MSRCFVLEDVSHRRFDVSRVLPFGKIVYIYDKRAWRPSIYNARFVGHLESQLLSLQFNPATDYVVATGDFAATVIFAATAASMYGSVQVLVWDAMTTNYSVVQT